MSLLLPIHLLLLLNKDLARLNLDHVLNGRKELTAKRSNSQLWVKMRIIMPEGHQILLLVAVCHLELVTNNQDTFLKICHQSNYRVGVLGQSILIPIFPLVSLSRWNKIRAWKHCKVYLSVIVHNSRKRKTNKLGLNLDWMQVQLVESLHQFSHNKTWMKI